MLGLTMQIETVSFQKFRQIRILQFTTTLKWLEIQLW